ncbi:MAG: NAD(P)H-dependent oxidoreductase, partial [Lachnospiraceae bacterium]|nr:NAD(P)H-dependent oxidoreductase [Lachnospiraceae bacterium]
MIGIYFSGTGNTKLCVDKFLQEYDHSQNIFSIEDKWTLEEIKNNHEIVIGYPVQYSNIPKILRDYVMSNQYIWKGKKVFVIATMGLFSGDGAGILARLLNSYGAVIAGGLHLK